MLIVSIAEAKAKLSDLLKKVEAGESVILTRHHRPIVEMRAITSSRSDSARPFGLCKGEFTVPADFNHPLPDEILDAFEGR